RHLDPRGSPSCVFLRPREPPIRPSPNLDGLLRLHRIRVSDRRRFRERRGGPGPFLDARLRRVHYVSGALLLRFRCEPPTAPRGGVRPHLRVPITRRVPGLLRRWSLAASFRTVGDFESTGPFYFLGFLALAGFGYLLAIRKRILDSRSVPGGGTPGV